MRLSVLLFTVFTFSLAASSYSQTYRLTIDKNNVTIAEIFSDIEAMSEFSFLYSPREMDVNRRVSVNATNVLITDILSSILDNKEIAYRITDRHIILYKADPLMETTNFAQGIPITGIVTDAGGELLPGVNVVVKGTLQGTVTGANGAFSLTVLDEDATLEFSFLGYAKQEILVGSQRVINVTMQEVSVFLEEVVTIGYTTSKRRDMVGSVAKISSETLATPAYSDIRSSLQGKASGLYVTGDNIRIRGINSISRSSQPLWIIDGVQGDHNYLNPNDIESVTILKDAAATAMYGSSGTNGVIVVTTKSHVGQKSSITVQLDGGISQYMNTGWKVMDSKTYMDAYDLAFANTAKYTETEATLWNPNLSYNWITQIPSIYNMTREEALQNSHRGIKDYTRNALYGQAYLSVNKGFDKGNALFSLTYRDTEPVQIQVGPSHKQVVGRVAFNISPVNHVTFSFNSINNIRLGNSNTAESVLMRPPHMPVWDTVEGRSYDDYWAPGENPIIRGNTKYRLDRYRNFGSTNYLKVNIDLPFIQGLSIAGVGRAGFGAGRSTNWYAKELRALRPSEEVARVEENSDFNYSYMLRGEISYNRTFGGHTVGAIGWVEGNRSYGVPIRTNGNTLNTSYAMMGTPSVFQSMSSSHSEGGSAAFMGRLTYNFKNKYFLEGVVRREGLSSLVEKYRWATFPSVGASWILSEESFWTVTPISLLKIRGSIGKSGNADVPSFAYIPGYQIRSNSGSVYDTYQITVNNRLAAEVQWETADNMDIGIDFGLLKNRINGSIAYFHKETSGLLLQVPLPPSAGIFDSNSTWANIGNLKNNGVEFNIDATVLTSGKFSWNTSFNYTYLNNEVLALHPQVDRTGSGIYGTNNRVLTRTGGKIATYFMSEFAGIDPQKGIPMIRQRDDEKWKATGETVLTNKLIPASNANNTSNQMYMDGKSYLPSYFGGWRNTFRYGIFDLNLMITYTGGHYYIDQVEWRLQFVRTSQYNLVSDRAENAWKKPGDIAKYPEIIYNGGFYYTNDGEPSTALTPMSNDYPTTSDFLKKADNIQLKEVTLGCNLPKKWISVAGMENARLFFNINNALYWATDSKIGNPDVGINNDANTAGQERWESFMTRTFSIGLSVKF